MRMLDASRFQDANKYEAYLKTPSGRLRSELAWENVRRFLPSYTSKRRALDVGGGTGFASVQLARMGHLIEIFPDSFFLRETLAEMAAIAVEIADRDGMLTAASFRDRLNNGRKVAILILEFFDKVGFTTRYGDVRRVRRDRVEMFRA